MSQKARYAGYLILSCSALFLIGAVLLAIQGRSYAQNPPQSSCELRLNEIYTIASEVCIGGPQDHICNGASAPYAAPAGPVSNSLAAVGAMVALNRVDMLNTIAVAPDASSAGVAWMRNTSTRTGGLLVGNVMVIDATPAESGFAPWTALMVQTSENEPHCAGAPYSAFVIQNADAGVPARVAINGASVDMAGTVMIQTRGQQTIFMALEGQVRVLANGQVEGMVAGQQITVGHPPADYMRVLGAPSAATPLRPAMVAGFPVELLDRPIHLPQPGFLSTQGQVNMRSAPSTDAAVLALVPAGEVMTILGTTPAGDWYHVRLASNGLTGWMFGDILQRNHGEISAVYVSTPIPPQRFGKLGTKAVVAAPAGVTLRAAPDAAFNPVHSLESNEEVTLLARSPYSPWVKVEAEGVVGWVALIALETRAIIDFLPIDYEVPPQPTPPPPTRVPGSWGFAFPDPSCFPNC